MINCIIGNKSTSMLVLGVKNPSFSLTPASASWSSLSSLLSPLSSGASIVNISQNFINWSSSANLSVVGHIVASNQTNNQFESIDVTDYANQAASLGAKELHFLIYRPFRHPSYRTSVGPIPADDLSSGSIVKIYAANSANPPQLLFFNSN